MTAYIYRPNEKNYPAWQENGMDKLKEMNGIGEMYIANGLLNIA